MIEPHIEHLRLNAGLENSIQVERFDATLSQIAETNDPKAIGALLAFFSDRCRFPEIMFSIIHTIERFDAETYAHEILKELPGLWKKSPYWADVLHFRIFNDPPSFTAYRKELSNADIEVKSAAREFLTTMKSREPKFSKQCEIALGVFDDGVPWSTTTISPALSGKIRYLSVDYWSL